MDVDGARAQNERCSRFASPEIRGLDDFEMKMEEGFVVKERIFFKALREVGQYYDAVFSEAHLPGTADSFFATMFVCVSSFLLYRKKLTSIRKTPGLFRKHFFFPLSNLQNEKKE